jgi:signal transduction histidine kinase
MFDELARLLERLTWGDHVCLMLEERNTQEAVFARFVADGLRGRDKCVVLVPPDADVEALVHSLELGGIDAGQHMKRGALRIDRESYLGTAPFEARAMLEVVADEERRALASGYSGLRWFGAMTWALAANVDGDALIDLEARLDEFLNGRHAVVVCQYSCPHFDVPVLYDVLCTHPLAVFDDFVCESPYYTPPALLLDPDPAATKGSRASWCVGHLKRIQRERRRLEDDLQKSVADARALAAENARLCAEAQRAVQMRDDFLALASHELRTPLTPLLLQLQHLRQSLCSAASRPPDLLKMIDSSDRQVARLCRLVDDLLDVVRISSGRFTLQLQDVNLSDLVRVAIDRHGATLAQAGCRVESCLQPNVVGSWDRLRIEQVVSHLLANAMKYGAGRPIRVTVTADQNTATLSVQDFGIGMSKDEQARIFDRFERPASLSHFGGLGLGLYVARQIAQHHGGTIRVESEPGAGATFTVELPLRLGARPS